jgi:hypothetical protein
MTEEEWVASDDPVAMLRHLGWRVSRRKRRLFACACCRQVWHLLGDPIERQGVEAAERYADGEATKKQLTRARRNAAQLPRQFGTPEYSARQAVVVACGRDSTFAASGPELVVRHVRDVPDPPSGSALAGLLRCVVGSPFIPPPRPPAGQTLLDVAVATDTERSLPAGTLDPARLAVLSDVLEDAGCADTILYHLLSPGPHVRGCWALDLILGKE